MIVTAHEVANKYKVDVKIVEKVFGILVQKGYAKPVQDEPEFIPYMSDDPLKCVAGLETLKKVNK